MWSYGRTDEKYRAEVKIAAGARYLTLSGRSWEGAIAVVSAAGQPEQPIDLARIGSDVFAAATISPADDARLRLQADTLPGEIAIAAYWRSYPSDRWRRALPACLNAPGPTPRHTNQRSREEFAQACGVEPLSASLAEIAADCLSGPPTDASLQSAALLLAHLAAHPLDRSPGLGALVAALCQKGSAP